MSFRRESLAHDALPRRLVCCLKSSRLAGTFKVGLSFKAFSDSIGELFVVGAEHFVVLVGPFHFYHRVKSRLEKFPFFNLSILLILKDKSIFLLC